MHRFLGILILLIPLYGYSQDDFLQSTAGEICECVSENGKKLTEETATDCLRAVANRHEKAIRRRYELIVEDPVQRGLFSGLLTDYLLEACPLLRTVRPPQDRREYRWSDGAPGRRLEVPQYQSPKRPPADTSRDITTEAPAVWRAQGKLLAQPGSKGLRLLTPDGEKLNFDLPAAVARKRDFDPGDEISLTYRREWRPREGRIVLVVVGIE